MSKAARSDDILIAFFSITKDYSFGKVKRLVKGHTETVADEIKNTVNGDLYRINKVEAAVKENEIIPWEINNFDRYGIIYLGFPIYYHTMPDAVKEFIKKYDFSGKTIIPFTTHSGSGLGRSVGEIQTMCPDATILDGLAVGSAEVKFAKEKIQKWSIESLDKAKGEKS